MESPASFPFPFQPYPIQHDFMTSLYNALEKGKLGIFESPTGTGKSLSLICGALTWLSDHQKDERLKLEALMATLNEKSSNQSESDGKDPFNWLNQQADEVLDRQRKAETKMKLDALDKYDAKIQKLKQASKQRKSKTIPEEPAHEVKKPFEKQKLITRDDNSIDKDDEDLLLEELESIEEEHTSDDEELTEEIVDSTKIFFCSRTHSQLAQFIGEIRRSSFGNDIRVVSLSSRQNSCINNEVNKLKSLSLINERCLDLQRKNHKVTSTSVSGEVSKKSRKNNNSCGCPALNKRNIEILSEDILTEVQDIEQIVQAGKKIVACPYYAARASIADGEVIVLPYNTILHKATREACGISLKNNVVIIDEAHNLLDAIGNIHSAQVNGYQLSHAHSQLVQYRDRYQKRFNPKTLLHLGQVIFIVAKLIRVLGGKAGSNPDEAAGKILESKIFTLPDFVLSSEIDNLNLFKILEFCKYSKISHKLHGFSSRYQSVVTTSKPNLNKNEGIRAFLKEMETKNVSNVEKKTPVENSTISKTVATHESGNNPFLAVLAFMETLTNSSQDGRILLKTGQTVGKGVLKFLLLNPAAHFQDIVLQARSVIVAGGTMQPVSEFQDQLFLSAGSSIDRISLFSCGHIIPPENILPIALGAGPSGKSFHFSYASRDSLAMVTELGRLLINTSNMIPAGVVCFFPSYDYEKFVIDQFGKTGVIDQIERKKKIFREPKQSSEVDEILTAYAKCIRLSKSNSDGKLTGAILFSVIGGKLSEGLNFSDDLGRCVIVVGLPFPNIKSVELQEQMKYLDKTVGSGAGQRHYENLCMKAVNQSIGRAVRHKDDYASVILLDQRYLSPSRQVSLPAWIQRSLESHERFGSAFASLRKFFQTRLTHSS